MSLTVEIEKIKNKIENYHILINYFKHENNERQLEFNFCLTENLKNKYIDQIHIFCNKDDLPDEFKSHDKITIIESEWLTYSKCFKYCNENLEDKICILLNLDIVITENNLDKLRYEFETKKVLCLSRIEINKNKQFYKDKHLEYLVYSKCQDAWIFKSPIFINDCDIKLGTLYCDNYIADRIYKSGYIPINDTTNYKIIHVDNSQNKNGSNYESIIRKQNRIEKHNGKLLLPNNESIKNINLDILSKKLNLNQDKLYLVKSFMFSLL